MMPANHNKGFTLLETLIAVFVIAIAIGAIFGLLSRALYASSFAKARLTAAYLAQEGIEVVRSIRDSNWLSGVVWDTSLPIDTFGLDAFTTALPDGRCSAATPVNFNTSYNCNAGSPSPYIRTVRIDKVDLNDDLSDYERIDLTVTVTWQQRGANQSIETKAQLFRWR